jgi:hypothetical protein
MDPSQIPHEGKIFLTHWSKDCHDKVSRWYCGVWPNNVGGMGTPWTRQMLASSSSHNSIYSIQALNDN